MNENPYQSPSAQSTATGVIRGTRDELRRIAKFQKGIIACLLLSIILSVVSLSLPVVFSTPIRLGFVAIGLASMVFVFLLATQVDNVAVAILLAILSFIPLIGLLVLLMVNGKATRTLKQNDISVGLLGADSSQI